MSEGRKEGISAGAEDINSLLKVRREKLADLQAN